MTGTCLEKINEAAKIIQKDYKMLKSTNNKKLLTKVLAATKIQRVFRGYRARKYLKARRFVIILMIV